MTAPADATERLVALERRLDRLTSLRDGWLAFTFVLSALALLTALVAVLFGVRAIDEAKDNVAAAGGTAGSTEAPAPPCKDAAGFPDSANLQDKGTEAASGTTISVEAGDFFFGPTCVSGVAAGTVT